MKSDLDRLLQERGLDAIIVMGPDGLGEANASFRYFAGDGHLTGAVIKRRGRPAAILHSDMERSAAEATGLEPVSLARWPLKEIFDGFGDPLSARVELYRRILADLGVSGRVALAGVDELGSALPFWDRLREVVPGLEIVAEPAGTVLEEARLTKDEAELTLLEDVAAVACGIVGEVRELLAEAPVVRGALQEGSGPLTVGGVRRFVNERLHAHGLAAPEGFILATNADAGIPHHEGDDAHVLRPGDLVLFDFFPRGASGYHHDVTRTWSLGPPPPETRAAYDDVRACFEHLMGQIAPGASTRDLQTAACEFFEARGRTTIRQDPASTRGYVHSLGHGIGLAVHEKPGFPSFRSGREAILGPGMVVTIEPGLYDAEGGYGVRLEDTVVVTGSGARSLSNLPLDLEVPVGGPARAGV